MSDEGAVEAAHTQGVAVGETSHVDCPGCGLGQHKKHDPEFGKDPNLLVQIVCTCPGDCAKRHQKDHLREYKP